MTDPTEAVWTDVYRGRVLVGRIDPYGARTTKDLRLIGLVARGGEGADFTYDGRGLLTSTGTSQGAVATLNGKDGFFEIAVNVDTGTIFNRTFVGGP